MRVRTSLSGAIGVVVAACVVAGCASTPTPATHADSPTPTAAACRDGANLSGAFNRVPVSGASRPTPADSGLWVEVTAAQGDTVLAAGRDSNWQSPAGESPARVARLSGEDGTVLAHVALAATELHVSGAPSPTSSPTPPTWDVVDQIAVGDSRVYVVWSRIVDGSAQDPTLVALDSCSLAVLASQPLPGAVSNNGHAITVDVASNTVWVVTAPPDSPTVSIDGFNGTTLSPTTTAAVNANSNLGCVVASGGSVWFGDASVQRIDPTTGAVSGDLPGLTTPSGLCVLTDGKSLYVAQDRQLVKLDAAAAPAEGYPAVAASGVMVAAGKTWIVSSFGTGGLVAPAAARGTGIKTSFQILSATGTPKNVWVVDFAGNLYAL